MSSWRAVRRLAAMALAGIVCAVAFGGAGHSQSVDGPAALGAEAVRLYQAGKYAEAAEIAKQVLAINEKMLGPEHPDVAASFSNLGSIYLAQGYLADAEPLFRL